jgi:hypothetical protein
MVSHLLAGRQAFAFRDCGALELKGIAAPLPAGEVVYEADPTAMLGHDDHFLGVAGIFWEVK